jgi:HK97 family phage major capsid protein
VATGNTATEMKFDGLMEAKFALAAQYQVGAEWIFHRDGVKQLAKLKNTDGQYIWQPSVVLGTPDMLLGKPVNMSEYAPKTFTSGKYVGMYGNLKNYWICDSLAMEIQVLTELYARTNQIDYISRIETDGAPVLAAAFARIKLG